MMRRQSALSTATKKSARSLHPREIARALTEAGASTDSLMSASSAGLVPLIADLARAVRKLAERSPSRTSVRGNVDEHPVAFGLERTGGTIRLTAIRASVVPEIWTFEAACDAAELESRLARLLDGFRDVAPSADAEEARRHLRHGVAWGAPERPQRAITVVRSARRDAVELKAELALPCSMELLASKAMRSDVLPLLFSGSFSLRVGDATCTLPSTYPFLLAELLGKLCEDAIDAVREQRPMFRKVAVGDAVIGMRVAAHSDRVAVTLDRASRAEGDTQGNFARVPLTDLGRAVVSFGRSLARAVVASDRGQKLNLRISTLRKRLAAIARGLRLGRTQASIVNALPDSYRAYAADLAPREEPLDVGRARLRFTPRWLATVPDLDLASVFFAPQSLIVGSARELACLDREIGEVRWKLRCPTAVSVMTPAGLARIEPDGKLRLVDWQTGDTLWSLPLSPRRSRPVCGAVVSTPGLPRLLILTEGERGVTAVDVDSGEIVWRTVESDGGAPLRFRRAGKLAIVTSSLGHITALDVTTGHVVWRQCQADGQVGPICWDRESLFFVSSAPRRRESAPKLHHLDPWSGEHRWTTELPPHRFARSTPIGLAHAVAITTAGPAGTGVVGVDRDSGELAFDRFCLAGPATAIAVDDALVLNSLGELCALDATTGELRFRQPFPTERGAEPPRRLDPVLRSGALFAPQSSSVYVLRPRDGSVLGTVDHDLVADLVKVDESCDVFVLEESGHVAAFGARTRLTLVPSPSPSLPRASRPHMVEGPFADGEHDAGDALRAGEPGGGCERSDGSRIGRRDPGGSTLRELDFGPPSGR